LRRAHSDLSTLSGTLDMSKVSDHLRIGHHVVIAVDVDHEH
jgi:hypothetical protein